MSRLWQRYYVIVGTFLVALVLSVYPLPLACRWWRPEFVILVAIFWISVLPLTISLVFLCTLGLFQDLLEGVPFGEHGLSLVIITYISILSYQRVRNFNLWKQMAWVFLLVALAQIPGNWVQSMAGRSLSGWLLLAPALVSAAVWPVVRVGLDRLVRHYRID